MTITMRIWLGSLCGRGRACDSSLRFFFLGILMLGLGLGLGSLNGCGRNGELYSFGHMSGLHLNEHVEGDNEWMEGWMEEKK